MRCFPEFVGLFFGQLLIEFDTETWSVWYRNTVSLRFELRRKQVIIEEAALLCGCDTMLEPGKSEGSVPAL